MWGRIWSNGLGESRQPVMILAEEDNVGIRYQAIANEDQLRRISICCSELQITWISDSPIIFCSYEFENSDKSKPLG
jgi:hypothetical protein